MTRSVVRSAASQQPLTVKADSCDWISNPAEHSSKSIRYSLCCCIRTNYVRFIVSSVVLMCLLYYQLNTIESTMLMNLRATASRYLFDFEIKSLAFKDGHSIPSKYNTTFSPPLKWNHQPLLTKSFALVVEDLDTPNRFKHWIIYNIPSNISELSEGILAYPTGSKVLHNDFGRFRYDGPSPHDTRHHRYLFRLFALSVTRLELSSTGYKRGHSFQDLHMAMKRFILQEVTLTGTYNIINHD